MQDTKDNIKKLRDFVLAINDNFDILQNETNRGALQKHYASKAETEQALKDIEDKMNAIMRIHVKHARAD